MCFPATHIFPALQTYRMVLLALLKGADAQIMLLKKYNVRLCKPAREAGLQRSRCTCFVIAIFSVGKVRFLHGLVQSPVHKF